MKNEKIFKILKSLAVSNVGISSSKHAACIMHRGDIVSFGINQLKSHPFQAKFAKHPEAIYLHAEIHAIYNALKTLDVNDLSKCSLYVLRVTKNNSVDTSCPCEGCMMAINTFNIKNVFYTAKSNCTQFHKM
jgi:tRNA(Arg) A34 adenosine deaminase TadA